MIKNTFKNIWIQLFILSIVTSPAISCIGPDKKWDSFFFIAHRTTVMDSKQVKRYVSGFKKNKRIKSSLLAYANHWKECLSQDAQFHTGSTKKKVRYSGRQLSRTAIAFFTHYLMTKELASLKQASYYVRQLEDISNSDKKYMYWRRLIESYAVLESSSKIVNLSERFVPSAVNLWMSIESLDLIHPNIQKKTQQKRKINKKTFSNEMDILYESFFYLVTQKAIIEKEVGKLDALGPFFETLVTDQKVKNKQPRLRLKEIIEHLYSYKSGDFTDVYNLNYTVLFLDIIRNEEIIKNALLPKKSKAISKQYLAHLKRYDLLYDLADTARGKMGALTAYIGSIEKAYNYFTDRKINDTATVKKLLGSQYLGSITMRAREQLSQTVLRDGYQDRKNGFYQVFSETDGEQLFLESSKSLWQAMSVLEITIISHEFPYASYTKLLARDEIHSQDKSEEKLILAQRISEKHLRWFFQLIEQAGNKGKNISEEAYFYAAFHAQIYSQFLSFYDVFHYEQYVRERRNRWKAYAIAMNPLSIWFLHEKNNIHEESEDAYLSNFFIPLTEHFEVIADRHSPLFKEKDGELILVKAITQLLTNKIDSSEEDNRNLIMSEYMSRTKNNLIRMDNLAKRWRWESQEYNKHFYNIDLARVMKETVPDRRKRKTRVAEYFNIEYQMRHGEQSKYHTFLKEWFHDGLLQNNLLDLKKIISDLQVNYSSL